jgi:hypothetical protein
MRRTNLSFLQTVGIIAFVGLMSLALATLDPFSSDLIDQDTSLTK